MDLSLSRALFLDRDGVINMDFGYVHRPDQITFIPGIFDVCHAAQVNGYIIVVVTNQAGVARGYYQERDIHVLHNWIARRFLEKGINLSEFYYCPCHPDGVVERYKTDSYYRKPNPGMFLKAAQEHCIDLASSIAIGDKPSDIYAAQRAGVGRQILLGNEGKETVPGAEYCRSLTEVVRMFKLIQSSAYR